MPQVPYSPVPQTAPLEKGTPNVNVQTPIAAFGGTVAAALEGLGKQVAHSSDEIFKRAVAIQELQNETVAKEADAQYMMKVGQLHADFSALQGKAASEAYPKYMQDVQKLRTEMRNALPNDSARKMYDSSSLSTMGRTIFNGAGHAAQQVKVAANNASSARIDMLIDTAAANPGDEILAKRTKNAIVHEIKAKADIGGWDEDQTEHEILSKHSLLTASRIINLADTEPYKAEEMLKQSEGQLTKDDKQRAENKVRAGMRNTGTRMLSQEVNADLSNEPTTGKPQKSLQTRLDEADKLADERGLGKDDPLFKDFLRQRVTSDYDKHNKIVKDELYRNRDIVVGAISGLGPNGVKPSNVDELKSISPEVAAAWDALPDTAKKAQMSGLSLNAKADRINTPERRMRFNTILGMASADDEGRGKFLDLNPFDLDLTNAQQDTVAKLQRQVRVKPEADPRVNRGMETIDFMLRDAHITKKENENAYNQVRGGMQVAIEEWVNTHNGKQPTQEEMRTIGRELLKDQIVPGFFWGTNKEPTYAAPVPEEVAKNIKADPKWRKEGVTPSEADIRRTYLQQTFQKLYGTMKSQDRVK